MELLTALVMGQPSLACDACVVRGGCPEPRPPPQRVVVTERLHQSANRRRVLPHAELKQAGPRRLASSSSTALGVDVRISGSLAFVRVLLAEPNLAQKQSSAIAASSAPRARGWFRFDLWFRLLRAAIEVLGVESTWQLAASCACSVPPRSAGSKQSLLQILHI